MFRLTCVALIAATLLVVAMAGPKRRPNRNKGNQQIQAMQADLDELKAEVAELFESDGGEEAVDGCKVHFYFHGNQGDVSTASGDNVNVKVSMGNGQDSMSDMEHLHEAHCEMEGGSVQGHVHIVQEHGDPTANFHVMFPSIGKPDAEFMLHVHEYGDLTKGCSSVGGHFMRGEDDIGDLGEVMSMTDGSLVSWVNDTQLSLNGPASIIGRSIKIHEADGMDLACCVIGWSAQMDTSSHHMASGMHEHHSGHHHGMSHE